MASDDELLADLTKHPGWQVLERLFAQSVDKRAAGIVRSVLVEDKDLDLVQLERERAYYKALRDLLRMPNRAAARIEKESLSV